YSSVDRRSRRADAVGQRCYSHSWRIALLERFWQARHPPRYAAYLIPSSPSFPHSSAEEKVQNMAARSGGADRYGAGGGLGRSVLEGLDRSSEGRTVGDGWVIHWAAVITEAGRQVLGRR